MTLQLKPTNGLTPEAFLEENGYRIYHSGPHETWTRCGADRLPVLLVMKDDYEMALVAYDLDEFLRIYRDENPLIGRIYLVKIVDLLPHVERLEARLKEKLRRESTKRRLGRFAIPFDYLDNQEPFGHEFARAILDKVFVIRAEALYGSSEISYVAFSDMFEEVQVGMKIPDYLWTATHDQDGTITELKADRVL